MLRSAAGNGDGACSRGAHGGVCGRRVWLRGGELRRCDGGYAGEGRLRGRGNDDDGRGGGAVVVRGLGRVGVKRLRGVREDGSVVVGWMRGLGGLCAGYDGRLVGRAGGRGRVCVRRGRGEGLCRRVRGWLVSCDGAGAV